MKIFIAIIGIIIGLLLIEIYRELRHFRVTHYQIASEKLNGLAKEKRVVFLSDLHNHMYGRNNEELIEAVRRERPSLILIGGDMLVGKNGCTYENAKNTVERLKEICPVYYANGNHEQRLKEKPENYEQSYQSYREELKAEGVQFLENESVDARWGEAKIRITGLEIPLHCYTHFHTKELKETEITERIGTAKKDCYEILLAHNPAYAKAYVRWGADLILSGHLHGGIVRIPGVLGFISPSFEIFPRYSGDRYEEGDSTIVVSKGLGTHTINIRLFNPAEVIVLHFKGNNKSCVKQENPV